jgi:carboxymethylenebutenolidase
MKKPDQPVIDLYDAYTHGRLDRRTFLDRLAAIAGGTAAATALLPILANDYARAEPLAPETDERLFISTTRFETGDIIDPIMPDGVDPALVRLRHSPHIDAYVARRKGAGPAPAVVVIHENRGLNPHIKDVARRVALLGYHAFAVDMLSPYGGTPPDEDDARSMIGKLDRAKTAAKLAAIVEQLALLKTHQRKVAAIGFCWGGGMTNALAVASPALTAGVSYYGPQAPAEDAAKIRAKLLLHYAGVDERINAGIDAYEAALKAAGVDFALYRYEGAQHGFNNDTNAARYDKAAADLAWSRTADFLKAAFE